MNIYLYILIYFNLIFSMTGIELAQKMKDRPKPTDTQSNSSMLLTNKKGKKKNNKRGRFSRGNAQGTASRRS